MFIPTNVYSFECVSLPAVPAHLFISLFRPSKQAAELKQVSLRGSFFGAARRALGQCAILHILHKGSRPSPHLNERVVDAEGVGKAVQDRPTIIRWA